MTSSIQKNSLKQPAPNIVSSNQAQKKRIPVVPKVGVVNVPNISKTPLEDTLAIKKQENPHTVYKIHPKQNNNLKGYLLSSIGIIGCGLLALLKIKKK